MTKDELLRCAEDDLDMILGYYSSPLHAKDRARLLRTTTAIKEALKDRLVNADKTMAENEQLHKLLAWIVDDCHACKASAGEKAFAKRILSAITHSGYKPCIFDATYEVAE